MNAAEKELIEEKFKGLHAFIISSNDLQAERDTRIFEKLDSIKIQTTKTNGRVSALEGWRWKVIGISIGAAGVIGIIIKML